MEIFENYIIQDMIRRRFRQEGSLQVFGTENTPDGPFILCPNHVGSFETNLIPYLIYREFRRWVYSLTNAFVYKHMRRLKLADKVCMVPVLTERRRSLDKVVEVLKSGQVVVIFPEGRRNRPKKEKVFLSSPAKTGAVRAAIMARVPIIPVGYQGPHDNSILAILWHWLISKAPVKIFFGKPIYFKEYYDLDLNENSDETKKILRELTRKIMLEIGKLSGQKYPESN